MAKQDNSSSDKTIHVVDKKKAQDEQAAVRDNKEAPVKALDTESEFAVNELREEKRDAE
ncbi:hypothetical protein [Herminiimonas aquatilis]|uniref:Uncharacterized protein n=1 Tax=Herminiimonas aquatilis TaxID=345342 RepID=A0ABW2J0L3_9BURK